MDRIGGTGYVGGVGGVGPASLMGGVGGVVSTFLLRKDNIRNKAERALGWSGWSGWSGWKDINATVVHLSTQLAVRLCPDKMKAFLAFTCLMVISASPTPDQADRIYTPQDSRQVSFWL